MDFDTDVVIIGETKTETFKPLMKSDKKYIAQMLKKHKPNNYGPDAPKSMNDNFYLDEIYEFDAVNWFEYYYNRIYYDGINDLLIPHDVDGKEVDMVNYACKFDAIECLKFLYTKYRLPTDLSCDICLEYNSIKCLKFLYENGYKCKYRDSIELACRHKTTECLTFMIDKQHEITGTCLFVAIQNNAIECARLLCDCGSKPSLDEILKCIDYNNVDMLKLFKEFDCNYNAIHMTYAIIKKRPHCTEYFDELRYHDSLSGSWLMCI